MKRWKWLLCVLVLFSPTSGYAHVGSPDVYAEGQAGPYKMSIVLRPPLVIPGVAEIEVRAESPGVSNITITPMPLAGEAAKHPPIPDTMEKPSKDGQFFVGHLWIMGAGSWQVRFVVHGNKGEATVSIPLPATAIATQSMPKGLGTLLAVLGIVLLLGMVGIVGAASSKAMLKPGHTSSITDTRRGRVAMAIASFALVVAVVSGDHWWTVDAAEYAGNIYKPLQMVSVLEPGDVLDLKLRDPGWLRQRTMDDFIPDHNHEMHLYVIRWPDMDVLFHLHPQPIRAGEFRLALPSMPSGHYRLYADVVHASGFPETIVSELTVPKVRGVPLLGDDAEGEAPPVTSGVADRQHESGAGVTKQNSAEKCFELPDGYTMIWKTPGSQIPRRPQTFRFELLDSEGKPPRDVGLYMGMLGHAAFVKSDGSVFAHVHPDGTMAMAAMVMANSNASINDQSQSTPIDMETMPGMDMVGNGLPNTVSFPYGFPSPGLYRIIVQMKHGNTVETGMFDTKVLMAAP